MKVLNSMLFARYDATGKHLDTLFRNDIITIDPTLHKSSDDIAGRLSEMLAAGMIHANEAFSKAYPEYAIQLLSHSLLRIE